ncbi:hypothetical protein KILIM_158_00010, partial [Kineosphaera limosa NBRC 100340]
ATATFHTLDLIRMHRDHQMYEWMVVEQLPLNGQPTTGVG